jgi:hypothetical protein
MILELSFRAKRSEVEEPRGGNGTLFHRTSRLHWG